MARKNQAVRDSHGRYIKVTILTKIKAMCNSFITKLEKWLK